MRFEIVKFEGDPLEVVRNEGGIWVSLRRMCEGLGVTTDTQRVKLREKSWATTAMIAVVAQDGKLRPQFMLHLDSIPMWLATIEESRVPEAVRPKLAKYQIECARVLRDHFVDDRGASVAGLEERKLDLEERKERRRQAALLLKIPRTFGLGVDANRALGIVAAEMLTDRDMHDLLPVVDERTHTITDVAKMFGVSANRAGRARKAAGLEGNRPGLCEVRLSKSRHSSRQVEMTILSDQGASLVGAHLVASGHVSRAGYVKACDEHDIGVVPEFDELRSTGS